MSHLQLYSGLTRRSWVSWITHQSPTTALRSNEAFMSVWITHETPCNALRSHWAFMSSWIIHEMPSAALMSHGTFMSACMLGVMGHAWVPWITDEAPSNSLRKHGTFMSAWITHESSSCCTQGLMSLVNHWWVTFSCTQESWDIENRSLMSQLLLHSGLTRHSWV